MLKNCSVTKKRRRSIDLDPQTLEAIETLADLENRSTSSKIIDLIDKGLGVSSAEKQQPGINTILFSLSSLSLDGALLALKVITTRLESITQTHNAALTGFIAGWDIDRLVEVSGIPAERLAAIVAGDKPSATEAQGLIKAGLDAKQLQ